MQTLRNKHANIQAVGWAWRHEDGEHTYITQAQFILADARPKLKMMSGGKVSKVMSC